MRVFPETIQLIKQLLPRRLTRWTVVIAFWLMLGFVSAVQWWYLYFGQQPYTWWVLLRAKIIVWGLWGIMTPLMLWLGARYRLQKPFFIRHLLVLGVCSLVVSALYIGLYAGAVWLNFPSDFPAGSGGFWKLTHWIYWNHFSYFYLGYWVVIAIEQMLGFARRSYDREAKTRELEKQLAQARLEQLRAQIHPHFLFNTLNAISSLIAQSDRDRAYDMVSRLSHLLRVGLEHGERQQITVAEEMSFAQEYLSLMGARFSDRLQVRVTVDPTVANALMPSLILQPLVENAVKFGTSLGAGLTRIEVAAAGCNNRLCVTISNFSEEVPDGPGSPTDDTEGLGIGLNNTRERLNQSYGTNYMLELVTRSTGTSTVTLAIPLLYQHE